MFIELSQKNAANGKVIIINVNVDKIVYIEEIQTPHFKSDCNSKITFSMIRNNNNFSCFVEEYFIETREEIMNKINAG